MWEGDMFDISKFYILFNLEDICSSIYMFDEFIRILGTIINEF